MEAEACWEGMLVCAGSYSTEKDVWDIFGLIESAKRITMSEVSSQCFVPSENKQESHVMDNIGS